METQLITWDTDSSYAFTIKGSMVAIMYIWPQLGLHYFPERSGTERNSSVAVFYGTEHKLKRLDCYWGVVIITKRLALK